jgi:hypothetical protein
VVGIWHLFPGKSVPDAYDTNLILLLEKRR